MSTVDIPAVAEVPAAAVVAAGKVKKVNIGPIDPKTGKNMTAKDMAIMLKDSADAAADAKKFIDHIIETTSGSVLQSSRLGNVRKAMNEIGASKELIDLMKNPEITTEANNKNSNKSSNRLAAKIISEANSSADVSSEGVEKVEEVEDDTEIEDPITIPEYFTLANVYNRLMSYDLNAHPTIAAVIDVMLLWCARPAEIMTLQISPESMAVGYSKGENVPRLTVTFLPLSQARKFLDWIQKYKETLPAPTKEGKKYRAFLEQYDGIKLKTLRVIGAEYAAYNNTARPDFTNDKEIIAIRRIALRHKPQVSSAEFYSTIYRTIPENYKLQRV